MRDLDWAIIGSLALACTVGACADDTGSVSTTDEPATTTGAPMTTTGVEPQTDSGGSTDDGMNSTGPAASSSSGGGSTAADSTGGSDSTGAATDGSSGGGGMAVCGNNIVEEDEVCDLAQLGGESCQSLGFQGGQLGCLLTCEDYNTLGCFVCGNGVVDLPEDCEGTVDKKTTCETLGFEAGEVTCGADCLYDTSDCSLCGDGIRQGPESCDGIDLGGETCESLGFVDGGTLACDVPSCGYDFSDCGGGEYFQDFEAGIIPPEFTLGGDADWFADGVAPIAGAFTAGSGDIADNQTSSMTMTAIFAVDGEVSFTHRESTEGCCDHLEFYIDGVQIMDWGGANPATPFTTPITAGEHELEWRYDKDGSVSTGDDTVWVDDIALVPGVPI